MAVGQSPRRQPIAPLLSLPDYLTSAETYKTVPAWPPLKLCRIEKLAGANKLCCICSLHNAGWADILQHNLYYAALKLRRRPVWKGVHTGRLWSCDFELEDADDQFCFQPSLQFRVEVLARAAMLIIERARGQRCMYPSKCARTELMAAMSPLAAASTVSKGSSWFSDRNLAFINSLLQ